jgi:hypothetical protein
MEENNKSQNTAKGCLVLVVILLALFVIVFVSCGGEDEEPAATKSAAEVSSMDIKEYAAYVVKEAVGEKTNNDVPVFKQAIDVGSYLTIDMNTSDNLTTDLYKIGLLSDSIDIYKKAFADRPDLNGLKLVWYSTLIDMKGNESEGSVMWILVTKENAATINWDNVLGDNLPEIADEYWEHDLFSR